MSLTLKRRIHRTARSLALARVPCRFRGPTKRTQQRKCCGLVEIFDCLKLGYEVWHTKCLTCEPKSGDIKEPIMQGEPYFRYYRDARGFDATVKGSWQRNYAEMIDRVFKIADKKVLDMGSACGAQASAMLDRGADVIAIERDAYFVEISPFENLRERLICADARNIPLAAGLFDFVHCSQVLEHIPPKDTPMALAELRRVAKPGAVLYAALPLGLAANQDPNDDVTHVNIQPMATWAEWLAAAGWQLTTDFDTAIAAEPMQQRYNWDYFVCYAGESE